MYSYFVANDWSVDFYFFLVARINQDLWKIKKWLEELFRHFHYQEENVSDNKNYKAYVAHQRTGMECLAPFLQRIDQVNYIVF